MSRQAEGLLGRWLGYPPKTDIPVLENGASPVDFSEPSPNGSFSDLGPPLKGKEAGKPHLLDAGKEDGSSAGVGATVAGSVLASEDHYDEDGDPIIG